jgi:uncharacterized protein
MNHMRVKPFILYLLLFCLATGLASAQKGKNIPDLVSPVTDLTSTLTSPQRTTLDSFLTQFAREHGSQVAVVILPSTGEETIEQYGIRLAEAWKIGRKGIDDGVILLIAKEDRKIRIEVGYGLEGAIPDAYSKRIIETIILPEFRSGDFYHGISGGVNAITALIRGEELPKPVQSAGGGNDKIGLIAPLTMIFMVILISIGAALRKKLGRWKASGLIFAMAFGIYYLLFSIIGISIIISLFLTLIINLTGYGRGGGGGRRYTGYGGFGGFGGGGFSSGGSFGGGFSGGGGSFGGGGASGSW